LEFDRNLIEASFAMQYNIRLSCEDIGFGEFCRLLQGIGADTPLGRIVAIRSEKNGAVVRNFGKFEHKIRAEWRKFISQKKMKEQSKENIKRKDKDKQASWEKDIGILQGVLERVFG